MRSDESGSAAVESILVALILVAPIVWGLGALAHIHRVALAVTAAARESGFDAARLSAGSEADRVVGADVNSALIDLGLDPARATVRVTPESDPRRFTVRIAYPVTVAWVFGEKQITVRGEYDAPIDRYRSR